MAMAKKKTEWASEQNQEQPGVLKSWPKIAEFLGQPVSVAQRWAKSGMPVAHEGRSVTASPDELNKWLGRESAGEPVKIASEDEDLAAELKRGLNYVKKHRRSHE